MKEMEIRGDIVEQLGNQTKVYLHVDCVIDASLLFSDATTAGICFLSTELFYMFIGLISRYCGRVVCYRCSASRREIPQDRVVQSPWSDYEDAFEQPRLHRVCDTCAPILQGVATAAVTQSTSPTSTTRSVPIPSSNTSTSATTLAAPQAVAAEEIDNDVPETIPPELDDYFLLECPVCRADLRLLGDEDLQAVHVASCLESHSSGQSLSFSGGSRHLVYRLQEGSPLVGTECVICFEEFEVPLPSLLPELHIFL